MTERHWATISEAAEYFHLSAKTLYSLAARKLLPEDAVLKIGRAVRINIDAVEAGGGKNERKKRSQA